MISGLNQDLKNSLDELKQRQSVVNNADTSPQDKHDAEVSVVKLEKRIPMLQGAIFEGLEFSRNIQGILNRLEDSKFTSRHRSILQRNLEDAQSRILRELGDFPTTQDHV